MNSRSKNCEICGERVFYVTYQGWLHSSPQEENKCARGEH